MKRGIMKKGILFITHEIGLNGASKSLLNIIDELQDKYDVHVLVKGMGKITDELSKRKCNVIVRKYYLDAEKLPHNNNILSKMITLIKKIRYRFFRCPQNKRTARYMARYVKKNNISIIHSNSSSTFMGAYIRQHVHVKHIWHFREFLFEDFALEPVDGWKSLYKNANQYTDIIIAVSESVKNKYQNIIKTPIKRIYNGIPKLQKSYPKEEHNTFNILQCGVISPTKGVDTSVRALAQLHNEGYHDIELYLAGIGNLDFCEEDLKMVKDHVHVLGFVNNIQEIRQKQIDVELVCSKSEAFGRVTIEAMQCGIPVIGANTAGTSELVYDEVNGLLFNMGDSNDLAKKIIKLYTDRKLFKKIKLNAYNSSEYYSITRCVNEIMDCY